MDSSDRIRIVVILRTGLQLEHRIVKDPEPELLRFIDGILGEFNRQNRGTLTLTSPYGIYNMNDISCILFPDLVADRGTFPLGFHPNKMR